MKNDKSKENEESEIVFKARKVPNFEKLHSKKPECIPSTKLTCPVELKLHSEERTRRDKFNE